MNNPQRNRIPFVYLAAGISSRFGGKIKALAPVGPQGEPLLSVSMDQAISAGFGSFILIASPATLQPLQDTFGDEYKGKPVGYSLQDTPAYRKKPWGTAHALLTVRTLITGPFGLGSSDDLFGSQTYKILYEALSKGEMCIPAYQLRKALPPKGVGNRAILEHAGNTLTRIAEHFNIGIGDIPHKYTGTEPAAMLIYGLHSSIFEPLREAFAEFVRTHPEDPTTEMLLPNVINDLLAKNTIHINVITTADTPLSMTFPEDEDILRKKLAKKSH